MRTYENPRPKSKASSVKLQIKLLAGFLDFGWPVAAMYSRAVNIGK